MLPQSHFCGVLLAAWKLKKYYTKSIHFNAAEAPASAIHAACSKVSLVSYK